MICFCLALLYKGLKSEISYSKSLIFLTIGILIIRLVTASEANLGHWDERYHALVAKNLLTEPLHPKLFVTQFEGLITTDWTLCYTWLHKPPFSLWLISLSYKMFGVSCLTTRLPSIILGSLGVLITSHVGKDWLKSDKLGLISGFLFGIQGLFIEMNSGRATTDHVDTSLIFFFLCAIWSGTVLLKYLKIWPIVFSIFLACALLSKSWLALGSIPIIASYWYINKLYDFRKSLYLLFSTIAGILTYMFWLKHAQDLSQEVYSFESKAMTNHIFNVIEGHEGGPFFYLNKMRILFGELIYVVICYYMYQLVFQKTNRNHIILFLWILGPFIFFSLAETKMQSYIMISLPAYAIISGQFIKDMLAKDRMMFKALAIIVLFTWVRYGVERMKPHKYHNRIVGTEQRVKKIFESFPPKTIIMNAKSPVEYTFYTDHQFVPFILSSSEIDYYTKEGFSLFVEVIQDEKYLTMMEYIE